MTDSKKTGKTLRWHDRTPELSQSMRVLSSLPAQMQTIIAEGVSKMAEMEFQANELMQNFRSLGREKVLGLYKSKNKRRVYDQNPALHKAATYMYLLAEDNQQLLALQVLELMKYVKEYLQIVQTHQQEADLGHVAELTHQYVHKGGAQAQQFLAAVKEKFIYNIETSVPAPKKQEVFQEDGVSIRITGL